MKLLKTLINALKWLKIKYSHYPALPEMEAFERTYDIVLKQAYEFFLQELTIFMHNDKILSVRYLNDKEWRKTKFLDKDASGYCSYQQSPNGKNIRIFIRNNGTVWGAVEILAHELVHAQQFLLGKTEFIDGELHHNGEKYQHKPWEARECEAEARDKQHRLVVAFISYMNKNYKNWL